MSVAMTGLMILAIDSSADTHADKEMEAYEVAKVEKNWIRGSLHTWRYHYTLRRDYIVMPTKWA